ncbi:TIGR02444 family protein [Paraferrimonas haliotis]|uniref:TIGR02444 family protein n=1 Tax=Paraferrimonas haliotis TaxID=2013866 RepID=UPI000BA8E89C|nr:TIGR02444 family protein [Paraferrimonas haliotis]
MKPIDWRQVERNYVQAECRNALLSLQDNYGVDVNLALLALYCDQQQLAISACCWPKLLATSAHWQQRLAPLRVIRRTAKHLTPQQYQRILAMELALERQLQQQLTPLLRFSESAQSNLERLGQCYDNAAIAASLNPFL